MFLLLFRLPDVLLVIVRINTSPQMCAATGGGYTQPTRIRTTGEDTHRQRGYARTVRIHTASEDTRASIAHTSAH